MTTLLAWGNGVASIFRVIETGSNKAKASSSSSRAMGVVAPHLQRVQFRTEKSRQATRPAALIVSHQECTTKHSGRGRYLLRLLRARFLRGELIDRTAEFAGHHYLAVL